MRLFLCFERGDKSVHLLTYQSDAPTLINTFVQSGWTVKTVKIEDSK